MTQTPTSYKTFPRPGRRTVLLLSIFILLLGTLTAAQAISRPADCGPMCQPDFWENAGVTDVQRELARGSNLTAPQSPRGGTALHMAAAYTKQSEVIAILLDAGAQIEYLSTELGNTPLIIAAAQNRDPKVVAILLERGARIDARNIDARTALHAAAGLNPNPAVTALLLQHGADIEERESRLGATPLHGAAALNPNHVIVKLLLEQGADLHDRTTNGDTVLHSFARFSSSRTVGALLLEHGAAPDERNHDGQTPCQIASERNDAPEGIRTLLCR